MTDAIWRGDVDTVRALVLKDPRLLHESARGMADSNWGPPMSYAANVGQDAIIAMLREMGAEDLQHAFDRACLQGQIETARRLHAMGARVLPGMVMGPCETLNPEGLAFLLELGADLADKHGDRLAPVALLLQTYCRGPESKHRCLELVAEHGSRSSRHAVRWRCIGDASICSKRTCGVIPGCSLERSLTKTSILRSWDATPTIPSHCMALRWPGPRCYISVWISMKSRLRAG